MAVPTGFEPAISSLTGTYARPLHHGTMEPAPPNSVNDDGLYPGEPSFVNSSGELGACLAPSNADPLPRVWPQSVATIV